ncbi:MAG TPA: hypothetical protein VNX00_02325 [Herbaspirillum sp.]|nr:hypothetical protein [Herbaspirillum sp.]
MVKLSRICLIFLIFGASGAFSTGFTTGLAAVVFTNAEAGFFAAAAGFFATAGFLTAGLAIGFFTATAALTGRFAAVFTAGFGFATTFLIDAAALVVGLVNGISVPLNK